MKNRNTELQIEQLDSKMKILRPLKEISIPSKGWINAIRNTLNMSLVQLAKRLKKTPVSVREIEIREIDKSVTLKKMIEVAEAFDFHFVYGFVPKESSLMTMIDKRVQQVAREVVMRTSQTMALEDQENSEERLQQAIHDLAKKLKQEMPKYLWD